MPVDEPDSTQEDRMRQAQELEILTQVLSVFQNLSQESRRRVLDTVSRFFDLTLEAPSRQVPLYRSSSVGNEPPREDAGLPTFSEDRSISAKQFMFQRQPMTDVEKVACLAYYLTHYRDTPHFKTLDISKLNTEAAQVKFSNPAVAVENATKQRYLVPASKGTKQLSALGEQFVLALPDRERAREIMTHSRPRRRSTRESSDS